MCANLVPFSAYDTKSFHSLSVAAEESGVEHRMKSKIHDKGN